MKQTFTKEEVQKVVAAVNFIGKYATFGEDLPKMPFMIQARNHWAILEQTIKKMEDHILEYGEVRKLRDDSTESTGRAEPSE